MADMLAMSVLQHIQLRTEALTLSVPDKLKSRQVLVSGARMAGACGTPTPFCTGPCVLTAHMFVLVNFASVHLPELVLSKHVAPSPSCPLVCGKYFIYLYSQCIFLCDGAGWLLLTALPWLCTSLGSLHLWRHWSFRHQPPSSSTDDEFNLEL